MKTWKNLSLILLLALALAGCRNKSSNLTDFNRSVYTPGYASGFDVKGADGRQSVLLTVTNPWQGAEGVETALFIARDGETAPEGFEGQVLEGDAGRIVCVSSTVRQGRVVSGTLGGRRPACGGRKGLRGNSRPVQRSETAGGGQRPRRPVGDAQYALRRFVVHALDRELCRAADYGCGWRLHLQEEHGQRLDVHRYGGGLPAGIGRRRVAECRHGEHARRIEGRLPEVRRHPLRPERLRV